MSHSLFQEFQALNAVQKRFCHIRLCECALQKWREYVSGHPNIEYVETVAGTHQQVDLQLPADAFKSAKTGRDEANVGYRYKEPIAALEDDDLEFPEPIEFAYFSLYNLFRRYTTDKPIDDWLIVNQALSAFEEDGHIDELLQDAIRFGILEAAAQDLKPQ